MGKTEQADYSICFIARWLKVFSRNNVIRFSFQVETILSLGNILDCQLVVAVEAVEVKENDFPPSGMYKEAMTFKKSVQRRMATVKKTLQCDQMLTTPIN